MYSTLGISKEVFAFGTKIEEELKERFAKIDEIAEYNQLKVIHAMQASKVSEACLYGTTGYGYNDLGRDTLEQVYATCFGTEDALVRPPNRLRNPCACNGAFRKSPPGRRTAFSCWKTVRHP